MSSVLCLLFGSVSAYAYQYGVDWYGPYSTTISGGFCSHNVTFYTMEYLNGTWRHKASTAHTNRQHKTIQGYAMNLVLLLMETLIVAIQLMEHHLLPKFQKVQQVDIKEVEKFIVVRMDIKIFRNI